MTESERDKARALNSPLPAMPQYYGDAEGKRRFTRRMFDDSAPDYDRIDRVLALRSGSWYRRQALVRAGLAQGMQMLDVAIGTGLVAREALTLVGAGGRVVGVDPSDGMISHSADYSLQLARGRAEALPFASASFDFLCMGYAIRHLADVEAAFQEFRRVLRPGGRVLVLEITRPEGRVSTALLKAYLRGVVPAVAALFSRSRSTPALYRYYWDTIEACAPPERILDGLRAAGFERAGRGVQLGIFSEFSALVP